MIEVPAILVGELDKINLHRENLQSAVIKNKLKKDPKIFQVVVLSGEKSDNPSRGTAYGNTPSNNSQEPNYFFSRVRSFKANDFEFPDPFSEPDKKLTKQLVSMHPIAFTLENTQRSPQEGEIWSARYQSTGNRTSIVLMERVGLSKKFLNLREKDSLFQQFAVDWKKETMQQFYSLDGVPQAPGDSTSVVTTGHSGYRAPLRRYYVGNVYGWKNKQVYNGSIPKELLGVTNQGTIVLKDIVPSWNQLEVAFFNQFGFQISIAGKASGIRSYDRQVKTKNYCISKGRGHFAAYPGTSKHGWGMAIDWKVINLDGKKVYGSKRYRTATYKWMFENAPRFGFHNPPWALEGARGPDEPWHFEWIKQEELIKRSPSVDGGET